MLTVSGLIVVVAGGAAMARGELFLGAGMYLLGNLFDSLDGELARKGSLQTAIGPFLDSICDHLGDFALFSGILWFYLQQEAHGAVMLIFFAMFGSIFNSHVRSRAGMIGMDTKRVGAFTRLERMIVILLGILINQVTLAFAILAFFTTISALQRILYVISPKNQKNPSGIPPLPG